MTLLSLLDASAAFDCVEHQLLLHGLHGDFGVTDAVPAWITSFVCGRSLHGVVCSARPCHQYAVMTAISVVGFYPCCRHAVSTSTSLDQLLVPSYRRTTIGRRAFPIAGARVWNGLPSDVTSVPSLAVFGRRLKTELFRRCYNAAWLLTFFPLIVVLEMDFLFRPL